LFCNAGILSALGLNWKRLFCMVFTDPVGLLERSDATIQNVGEINEEGMGKVFACNVFGHYVMV
jgi:17beta-estradiol 17-dehydrogenase/3beta-hydroxysteroid 3-dehydrogenase